MDVNRRAFLVSAAAAGALAGCLGSGNESNGDGNSANGDSGADGTTATRMVDTTESQPTDSDEPRTVTTGATATSFDHPAAAALAGQPFRGPLPGAAPATVIAFEDPSCHNCERFNTETLPELESKLVDPGKLTYVYRNFPHAFEWGKPAMQALEATYAREESAFWKLETHYFATQDQFSESNVLDRTRKFLAAETSLDAAAVVADTEAKKFNPAVKRDTDAGNAAGVMSTPTFYLFRGGEFLTEVRGAQSYQVFEQALGI